MDRHSVERPIVVCYVDDDPTFRDRVRSAFADDDRLEVRTEASLEAAKRHLDSIECLVSAETPLVGSEGEDGNEREHEHDTDLESLEAIHERDPELPVVYFTDERREELLARRCSIQSPWTDCLQKGDDDVTLALLGSRIRTLVDRQRQSTLARRTIVALETVQNGVAIVTPQGTFEFVDRVFAATFGTDPDDLLDQPWHTVFPDEEADRLRSTALPTVDDGWRWTGRCTGTHASGTTVTTRTDIVGLEDGGLVFVLGDSTDSTGENGSS
ncbi:PAS domain-containing protein [Halobacteria archaeon AArc-m2/3/4]|uniref:PAS domain-containing protein n=1 Tax=Natronoglomus mannanivorans TaxID=2979990 RepID=A0ABT2QB47_9EURY|nr:PAS domain-containing protein [Halobacteria archaeon AArc-m2/3/4]